MQPWLCMGIQKPSVLAGIFYRASDSCLRVVFRLNVSAVDQHKNNQLLDLILYPLKSAIRLLTVPHQGGNSHK